MDLFDSTTQDTSGVPRVGAGCLQAIQGVQRFARGHLVRVESRQRLAQGVRLARLGFSLMQGGYRRLLLYPYRGRI